MYTCVYLLEKPFASELETHTNEINVSQVSATLYTFIAETLTFQKNGSVGAIWLTCGRSVFVRNFTIPHRTNARAHEMRALFESDLKQILLQIMCLF